MSRLVETLDDLIDRVAADLTQAPTATGLGERVAAQLDRPRFIEPWMPAASLAALVLVVIGVALSREPSPAPLVVKTNPAPAVQTPSRDVPTAEEARAQMTQQPSAARTATEGRARSSPPAAIPALPSPALPAIDQLSVDELAIPRVEIDQLDVSTLAIDDLTIDSDSKEPQP